MAEYEKQYFFDHRAIVEGLIKRQGIHEGRWMLTCELGLKGTNVNVATEEGAVLLDPAGIITLHRIGITRTKEDNNLTVDAAEINPPKTPTKSTKRPTKKGR